MVQPGCIAALLRQAEAALTDSSDSPSLDAQLLLAHVLDRPRSYLYTWPEAAVEPAAQVRFRDLVARRGTGEPVAYLLGRQGFWDLELEVGPGVLVPRPETELLVELALERIPPESSPRVVDLGTGTGAIAFAIARERPRAHLWAVERSSSALAIAERNRQRLELSQVQLLEGSWYAPLDGQRFDLIVSNPPYIGAQEPELASLTHEPRGALVAEEAGLADLQIIIDRAPEHLEPGGWLLVEHGYRQGPAVRGLMTAAGLTDPQTVTDLQGHERVTLAQATQTQ